MTAKALTKPAKPATKTMAREEALALMLRWNLERTPLFVYFSASNAGFSSATQAELTEVGSCLVFRNDTTVLRIDLEDARFQFGPMQVLLAPSKRGRAAAISQSPEGLAGDSGLHIALASGHFVFVCEFGEGAKRWIAFTSMMLPGT